MSVGDINLPVITKEEFKVLVKTLVSCITPNVQNVFSKEVYRKLLAKLQEKSVIEITKKVSVQQATADGDM